MRGRSEEVVVRELRKRIRLLPQRRGARLGTPVWGGAFVSGLGRESDARIGIVLVACNHVGDAGVVDLLEG